MAASVRLLGLLADQLTRMEVRFQPVFSPDFPGEPEALLIGPLLILPGHCSPTPMPGWQPATCRWRTPVPAGKPWNGQPAAFPPGTALPAGTALSAHRRRCPGGMPPGGRPDADPRKIRRLGERLIAQEFARGESGTVREGWLTAVGAARTADRPPPSPQTVASCGWRTPMAPLPLSCSASSRLPPGIPSGAADLPLSVCVGRHHRAPVPAGAPAGIRDLQPLPHLPG